MRKDGIQNDHDNNKWMNDKLNSTFRYNKVPLTINWQQFANYFW